MHPRPIDAPLSLPAFVLALVLLGVLAVVGGRVWIQMGMAPGTLLTAGAEAAIAEPTNVRPAASNGFALTPSVQPGPGWETLTTPQKLALYPLAERWALISESQKRRWLSLSTNFSALPPEEQDKFHDRMADWASLSAQQRNQARLNYAVTNKLAPDDKRAQWEAYQALSDEERMALAAKAAPKPTGAATALRPVSPQKLAQVPAATQANPNRPNAPKIPPVIDQSPRVAAPVTPAAPPSAGPPASHSEPTVVETAPVSVPVAVPSALPPLGASSSDEQPSANPVLVTPDTTGLYPQ